LQVAVRAQIVMRLEVTRPEEQARLGGWTSPME
jgi:hypothetical protein